MENCCAFRKGITSLKLYCVFFNYHIPGEAEVCVDCKTLQAFRICTWTMKSPGPMSLFLLGSSGALPWPDNLDSGKPRVPANHPGLRLLRRMPPQVWLGHCLEILHWDIRLFVPLCYHWWQGKMYCLVFPFEMYDNKTLLLLSGCFSSFSVHVMT